MKKLIISLLLITSFTATAFEGIKEVTLNDGTIILAADNGLTLYTFDVDPDGSSQCFGGCLSVWPAMTVEEDQLVEAPFSTTTRPDGTLQLMLNERPLYFFVGDQNEGDFNGDGLQGVWHIVEL